MAFEIMQESQLAIHYLVKFSTLTQIEPTFPPNFPIDASTTCPPTETHTQVHPWLPPLWVRCGRCVGVELHGPLHPRILGQRTHLYAARCKLNANRRLGLQVEFIARETWEQITFANTGVTDKDNCKGLEGISDIDIGIG